MSQSELHTLRPRDQTPRPSMARLLHSFRKVIGGDRFENLYKAICLAIPNELHKGNISLLDYGCGAMNVSLRLKTDGQISKFMGMDIFPKPGSSGIPGDIWENYHQIPTSGISKSIGTFDLAIVVDVLHHASEEDQPKILRSLAEVSQYVMIKDHFEYGFISRQILRLADFYGNYAFGVNVPKRYFNKDRWSKLLKSAGVKEILLKDSVKIHKGLSSFIMPPRLHFISVLQKI